MVAAGPDVQWGLVKADEKSSAPLKEALCWLHARVHSPGPLKHPSEAWPDWEALIVQRPKCFKAMVKRALSLDALRQRCLAALCRLHKQLTALHGVDLTESEGLALSDAVEACPVCRLAFESRVAWAAHASRLHGYRIPATAVAAGRTCRACGKTYATPGRLHRHLQATPACCAGWGRFRIHGDEVSAHPQRPPVQSAGTFVEDFAPPPDTTSEALAKELASLPCDSPVTDLEIYDTVIAHIAPLGVLRQTVADWKSSLNPATALYEVAENVELVLTPQCVADSVKHTNSQRVPTRCPCLEEASASSESDDR